MTTPDTAAKQPKTGGRFVLPDPPERELDEKMSTVDHLHQPGNTHHLAQHLGNPESTLVTAERYVSMMPERRLPSGRARRVPDLLIAFGVDPEAYRLNNGYIVQEQGKPPDFVLEVASRSTGAEDTGPKRADYEALGVAEYWRFDETGEHHKTKLAGDRLVDGRYEPIAIEELADGVLLGIQRRAEHPPALGAGTAGLARSGDGAAHRHVRGRAARAEMEREGRIAEREARIEEMEARATAEAERNAEREARLDAEARIRELEEENQRLRGG